MDKFAGILIADEHTGPEKVEYVCSWCNRSLVRLSDRNSQSESWFCRNCSIEFNSDDEKVSHKQKLSIPDQEIEPAVTSIQTDQSKSVEIRHKPELCGGFAALAKKGTIRFTSYHESNPR
jgi:DNA-directed RNA polymerase subunit RPC12/RpoP